MPLISTAAEDDSAAAALSFRRGGVRDQVDAPRCGAA